MGKACAHHDALIEPVEAAKSSVAFLAHISLEDRGIGLAQVDDHQSINDVGKFAVEIEAHQPASHLGILLDQDGHSFAIFFHIGDRLRELVEIPQNTAKGAAIPAAELGRAEGCACLNEAGKLAAVFALLKIADNHLARQAAVLVAYADRAEQHWSLRVSGHETRDPLPQQKQRRVLPLILRTHKRAAQFESGANLQKQLFVVAEHGVRVEALDAMVANDLIGVAGAISTGQFLFLLIPEQQVPVIGVETIEVCAASGTFAGGAEGDFAEASKLIEQVGQLGGARRVHGKFRVFGKQPLGRQRRNIVDDELQRNRGSNLFLRLARKRGTHLGGQRYRLPAPIRQQVSAQTTILGSLLVAIEVGDQFGRDRAADANLHVFLALLQKFLQEEKRPQLGIDQTEQLEGHAVAAAEIYRQSAGPGPAHQASSHGAPCGIGDL